MSPQLCIVDDESGIGKMCQDYLADSYSVQAFTSPEEALAAFEKDYHPDLLLTDIKMPGIDGFEMAKRIHQKNPEIPVVMMSGYANKNHLLQAIETEAAGFIEKPFSPKKMKATLEAVFRKAQQVQKIEELNKKYEALTSTLMELNARYVERYAKAENRLMQADTFHHPNVKEALEFLMQMRVENRLNSTAETLVKEIAALRQEGEAQSQ